MGFSFTLNKKYTKLVCDSDGFNEIVQLISDQQLF